jgi:hypothetical protein
MRVKTEVIESQEQTVDFDYVKANDGIYKPLDWSKDIARIISRAGKVTYVDLLSGWVEPATTEALKNDKFVEVNERIIIEP